MTTSAIIYSWLRTRNAGVTSRPADRTIFFSAVSCRSRYVFTICSGTSAIPLSQTDCDIQETL